ncbi:hypothetical protein SVAN01_05350 [Stagonosporopsis vannaccii]|nr:hypothetical protein SVAN01_05350 [Stagonosporopsis vannaccii]
MHRLWHIPELLVQIVSFLPAANIDQAFLISHHFRTTLKANLPPHMRPLPDYPRKKPNGSQSLLQDVCAKAKAFNTQEASLPAQLMMTDTYFHWREAARYEVLRALKPSLHPVLAQYATHLIDGYEALAEREMGICLQTDMPYPVLYDLMHGRGRQDLCGYLAVTPPTVVTVSCLTESSWDPDYANVRSRDHGGVKIPSVKIERDGGVRMNDVLDELRGPLVAKKMPEGVVQGVVLIWAYDDCRE